MPVEICAWHEETPQDRVDFATVICEPCPVKEEAKLVERYGQKLFDIYAKGEDYGREYYPRLSANG